MSALHPVAAARFASPALVMAPMEGVHDVAMRAVLTELGGFRWGVTEFFRVSQVVPPLSALLAHAPELAHGACTPAGVPIDVQLLGSDLANMAETAARLATLGVRAIDLNFGCPAKTVNRHDGGASLLKSAERIYALVKAVRAAVPPQVAVSAKLRLGWEDPRDIGANAAAAAEGGAAWLTIHGRTRQAGYRPPALWRPIGHVARTLGLPVVANGDLFTVEDILRCQSETGLTHFMLGRGPLADPTLAPRAAAALGTHEQAPAPPLRHWSRWLRRYAELASSSAHSASFLPGRFKQWGMLARRHAGIDWLEPCKRLPSAQAIIAAVEQWEQRAAEAATDSTEEPAACGERPAALRQAG